MIDMFSILVIFLLMNFSSTGEIFFISKNVKLPTASHAHPLESLPLVTVTEKEVIFDAEKMGNNPVHIEEKDMNMPQLKSRLQQARIMEQQLRPDVPFKGAVNIQADENVQIIYLKRVMNTLISESWNGINFATSPVGGGGSGGHNKDEE